MKIIFSGNKVVILRLCFNMWREKDGYGCSCSCTLWDVWKAAGGGGKPRSCSGCSSPLWQKVEEHLWILELFNISLCQKAADMSPPPQSLLWASSYLLNLVTNHRPFTHVVHKLKQLFKMKLGLHTSQRSVKSKQKRNAISSTCIHSYKSAKNCAVRNNVIICKLLYYYCIFLDRDLIFNDR